MLRRRSLARLRREVEPVDPAALGRFLPAWQGVAAVGETRPPLRGTAALERLAEVVDQLSGVPIPASVLERDVLPARVPGYQPRLLDELGALGEVAWVGHGSLGRDDGRIVLVRPGRELLRPTGTPDWRGPPAEPLHEAIRDHLRRAARPSIASCSRRRAATLRSRGARRAVGPRLGGRGHQRHLRAAAGAPLEAAGAAAPGATAAGRAVTALGPPEAAGRWSLVGDDPTAATAAARPSGSMPSALALLDRHGVLVREAVMAEGIEGGFARDLPDAPSARGGRPDPARLLRRRSRRRAVRPRGRAGSPAHRPRAGDPMTTRVHLLAAADPANPYGAALPWPRRGETDRRPFQRAAGASVVLVDGVAALYLDRGGTSLQTLPAFDDPAVAAAPPGALRGLVADGRLRELVIRVDGDGRTLTVPGDVARGRLRRGLSRARPARPIGGP